MTPAREHLIAADAVLLEVAAYVEATEKRDAPTLDDYRLVGERIARRRRTIERIDRWMGWIMLAVLAAIVAGGVAWDYWRTVG